MAHTPRIGVVGVGMIGTVVVRGLLAAGYQTDVFDIDAAAVATQVARGARAAQSAADIGRDCDVVLVCVVSGEQLHAVFGEVLMAARPIIVVHSTVGPDQITELAAAWPAATLVDGPVSDNREDVERRLFTFLGTPDGSLPDGLAEVLNSYCHGFEVVGPLGAGQVVKLVCNTISMVTSSAVKEALDMCAAYGIEPATAARVATNGSANSWILANWAKLAPRPAIMRKDLGAAIGLGRRNGQAMTVTAAARDASEALFG